MVTIEAIFTLEHSQMKVQLGNPALLPTQHDPEKMVSYEQASDDGSVTFKLWFVDLENHPFETELLHVGAEGLCYLIQELRMEDIFRDYLREHWNGERRWEQVSSGVYMIMLS